MEVAAGAAGQAGALLGESAALHRAIDNPTLLPWCLEGLAGVAAARGQWEHAARLCGAREALRARLGLDLPPAHPAGYAATLSAVRAALGEGGVAAAHAAGRTLPLDRVLVDAVAPMADDGQG